MPAFNASVWPPLQFPAAAASTGPTSTAPPLNQVPTPLPVAVATTVQTQGAAPTPVSTNAAASAAAAAATNALFKIFPPTFPTVRNS